MKSLLTQILGFAFILILSGCGTDTGNPGDNADSRLPEVTPTLNGAQDIARSVATEICTKLSACYSGAISLSCSDSILSVSGLAPLLGYASHSTLNEVANDSGKTINLVNSQSCLTEINQIQCMSSAVSSSYNANDPGNFNNVGTLISTTTSCSQVGM